MSAKIRVWDLPVRMFHWLLAASFIVAYLVAESDRLQGLHVVLGYTALGLIAFRIVWGFVGSRFARFRSFLYSPSAAIEYARSLLKGEPQHYLGHNPLGSYAIYAILLLGLATGVTGYMTLNETGGESAEDLHGVFANVWLGVVLLHVAGVVIGSWAHRENLVRAMVTGYKEGFQGKINSGRPDGGEPVVPAGRAVGIAIAIGIAAFWTWSLLTGSIPGRTHEQEQARKEATEQGHPRQLDERGTRVAERADRD